MSFPDVIPYDYWSNSQLSVVKFFGSCTLDGKKYVLDYDHCEVRIDPKTQEERYFPDLITEAELKKRNSKKRHGNIHKRG